MCISLVAVKTRFLKFSGRFLKIILIGIRPSNGFPPRTSVAAWECYCSSRVRLAGLDGSIEVNTFDKLVMLKEHLSVPLQDKISSTLHKMSWYLQMKSDSDLISAWKPEHNFLVQTPRVICAYHMPSTILAWWWQHHVVCHCFLSCFVICFKLVYTV